MTLWVLLKWPKTGNKQRTTDKHKGRRIRNCWRPFLRSKVQHYLKCISCLKRIKIKHFKIQFLQVIDAFEYVKFEKIFLHLAGTFLSIKRVFKIHRKKPKSRKNYKTKFRMNKKHSVQKIFLFILKIFLIESREIKTFHCCQFAQ